ncbi:MAG: 5-formyltetrahydrofolate cyclo-ligase [Akkermansia sp.]
MITILELKSNLRRRILRDLKHQSKEQMKIDSLAIRRRLIPYLLQFEKEDSKQPLKVAVFAARPYEIDLIPLVKLMPEIDWYFPQCVDPLEMVFRQVQTPSEDLQVGYKGIREPLDTLPIIEPMELDVIITPGAGFSLDGKRLGFGGGFYDKLFDKTPQAVKVGICLPCQIYDDIPHAEHDYAVDYVVVAGNRNILPVN